MMTTVLRSSQRWAWLWAVAACGCVDLTAPPETRPRDAAVADGSEVVDAPSMGDVPVAVDFLTTVEVTAAADVVVEADTALAFDVPVVLDRHPDVAPDVAPICDVLMVNGVPSADAGTAPYPADIMMKAQLEQLGCTVTQRTALQLTAAEYARRTLVLVSPTVESDTAVGAMLRTGAVPVIVMEKYVFPPMGMTAAPEAGAVGFGQETSVTILEATHPLAAGLSGTVAIYSQQARLHWGVPGLQAIKIASVPGMRDKLQFFAYETGASMVGLAAPARRIGFGASTVDLLSFNGNGWRLFDAAVRWAIERP